MVDYTLRRIVATFAKQGAPDLTGVITITPASSARQVQPTKEELARLMQSPDLALRFLITACAEAGLRSGTAVRVAPEHAVDNHIVIRTKKGGMTNTPISPALAALMGLVPADADTTQPYVVTLGQKNWKDPLQELEKRWARWKRKCKVRTGLRFHDLRRGLARRLYAVTGDARTVQALLSHKSLASTLWYLDATNRSVTIGQVNAAIQQGDSL